MPVPEHEPRADRQPSSEHAQAMVDNLTTAVLLCDAEQRLLAMNGAAEALLEVSANQVCGTTIERLLSGGGLEPGPLSEALERRRPFTHRELPLALSGGRAAAVDCTVTPLGEPDAPGWTVFELMPVDRHRRIEREEHLVSQSQSARSLLRALAHEIRNPLGGLRGAAQLLARELTDDALREYTRIILEEADRLQSLLDRMLGPRTPPKMRALNVHEVTERVRALIEAEAPDNVSVSRDYDPSIPPVDADRELLIQATLNVARNAVQAVEGGGRITLRTRVRRQVTIGQTCHRLVVRIDVVDDGPGVPGALRSTLFYPLVTARSGGTGLGLSIAQSLVNQHGGLIEWRSEPGETTFGIVLPVEQST